MISAEAYVLTPPNDGKGKARLSLETILLTPPADDELLVRPIFGCWEGNMGHALMRAPIDLCAVRGGEQIILGNAGVVWVESVGKTVKGIAPGDCGLVFCAGDVDEAGYPKTIYGYDQPGSIGLLAKRTKLKRHQIIRLPRSTPEALRQWAAFSLRYVTAWSNWRAAYRCWRVQSRASAANRCVVFGYGGGVAFAQTSLARLFGCSAYLATGQADRIAHIEEAGISALLTDRAGLQPVDAILSDFVRETLGGRGVDILIDNVGDQFRSSLKMLARQGVITTSGWKHQTMFPLLRPQECINRHIHVFTHYANHQEGRRAVAFADRTGWLPPIDARTWQWEEIPELAEVYLAGTLSSYFPIYRINDLPA